MSTQTTKIESAVATELLGYVDRPLFAIRRGFLIYITPSNAAVQPPGGDIIEEVYTSTTPFGTGRWLALASVAGFDVYRLDFSLERGAFIRFDNSVPNLPASLDTQKTQIWVERG